MVESEQVELPNDSDDLIGFQKDHSLFALFVVAQQFCSLAGKDLLNCSMDMWLAK